MTGRSLRYAERLQRHLIDQADDRLKHGVYFSTKGAGIIDEARPAYEELAAHGDLHGHVDHVRSSQAFALNLFAGMGASALGAVWGLIDPTVKNQGDAAFEYCDPADDLKESQATRPHQTQVDVVLRGGDDGGSRHLAFIEVKLSETAFGPCSAFERETNDTRHVCRQPGPWGGNSSDCFQLRNHGTAERRRYDQVLDPTEIAGTSGAACEFLELNQPMRNVALAKALIDRGEADHIAVCLCAPTGNRNVWRQWRRTHATFDAVPGITLVDLPAHLVAAIHPPARADHLFDRYQLEST